MKAFSLPDITGTGSLQSTATVFGIQSQPCKWWQFSVVANTSSSTMRVGDSTITSTRGQPVGGHSAIGQFSPPIAEDYALYDLKDVYFIVPSGDTASLSYGV